MSSWRKEFNADFDVPPQVAAIAAIAFCSDTSWHNDVCPSFGWFHPITEECIQLFSDHPDPEMRELDLERFRVLHHRGPDDAEDLYIGDDVDAAIEVFRKAIESRFANVSETFDEFLASRRYVADLEEELDIDFGNDDGKSAGFVYDGCYYIESVRSWPDSRKRIDDCDFYAMIERSEFTSNRLEELEATLYHFAHV